MLISQVECKRCAGIGTEDRANTMMCNQCLGKGTLYAGLIGIFLRLMKPKPDTENRTCPACRGTGTQNADFPGLGCGSCSGKGYITPFGSGAFSIATLIAMPFYPFLLLQWGYLFYPTLITLLPSYLQNIGGNILVILAELVVVVFLEIIVIWSAVLYWGYRNYRFKLTFLVLAIGLFLSRLSPDI